jgi:hypothetical protein
VLANGFDIVQIGRQVVPPIATHGFADPALVEANAPELGQHRSDRRLHAVGHSGAAVQQKQRLAVVTALPYCEESTGGFHDEVIHQDAGPFHQPGVPQSAVELRTVAARGGLMDVSRRNVLYAAG